jgi:hypothetical protein
MRRNPGAVVRGLLPALGLLLAGPAAAAPLSTDRPGNGNAATVVAPARLQIESSVLYAYADDPVTHTVTFPLGFRYGVLPRLEARVLTSVLGIEDGPAETRVQPTDTALGLKVALAHRRDFIADVAVMADVFFPSGEAPFTSDVVVPEFRGAFSRSLPSGLGVLANFGLDVPKDEAGRYARFLYVGQINYAPPIEGRPLTLFVETYGKTAFGNRSDFTQIDAGILWLLTPDLQLDLFTQHGVDGAAPDFQIAIGFSIRA